MKIHVLPDLLCQYMYLVALVNIYNHYMDYHLGYVQMHFMLMSVGFCLLLVILMYSLKISVQ